MKKFFLIAAAAIVAFASCSKNESPVVQDENKAIGFGTYTGRAVTKADATYFIPKSQTYLQKQAFGVYAYNTEATPFTGSITGAKKFMVDERVTFSGASATDATDYTKYTYENKKYWPNDENNNLLTFWAYYPYEKLTGGFGANNFTVDTDPTKMVDLLLSDVKEDMTYTKATKVTTETGTVGVVPFTFHHALTRVQFYVKAADNYAGATITLDSLVVKGAYAQGTVTPTFVPANADQTTGLTTFEWATPTGATPAEFKVCATAAGATGTKLTKDGAFFPVNDTIQAAYLMIPQNIDNVVAEIKYTVTSTDESVDPVVNKVKVNLKAGDVTKWDPNKNIKYIFTVGLRPIEFTAIVGDWEDVTTVDFVFPTVTNSDDNSNDNPGTETGGNDNPTTGGGN